MGNSCVSCSYDGVTASAFASGGGGNARAEASFFGRSGIFINDRASADYRATLVFAFSGGTGAGYYILCLVQQFNTSGRATLGPGYCRLSGRRPLRLRDFSADVWDPLYRRAAGRQPGGVCVRRIPWPRPQLRIRDLRRTVQGIRCTTTPSRRHRSDSVTGAGTLDASGRVLRQPALGNSAAGSRPTAEAGIAGASARSCLTADCVRKNVTA